MEKQLYSVKCCVDLGRATSPPSPEPCHPAVLRQPLLGARSGYCGCIHTITNALALKNNHIIVLRDSVGQQFEKCAARMSEVSARKSLRAEALNDRTLGSLGTCSLTRLAAGRASPATARTPTCTRPLQGLLGTPHSTVAGFQQ